MTRDPAEVWYACYGSNLLLDRFLCYLRGGRPEGSTYTNPGARDPSPPRESRPFLLDRELTFAGRSTAWEGMGVAYLSPEAAKGARTIGRIHRITGEQFEDVLLQENRLTPGEDRIPTDLATIVAAPETTALPARPYGLVLLLGSVDGLPVLTFTTPRETETPDFSPPGERYVKTIIRGILETYPALAVRGTPLPGLEEDLAAYIARVTRGAFDTGRIYGATGAVENPPEGQRP